jgi:hypothetical protein
VCSLRGKRGHGGKILGQQRSVPFNGGGSMGAAPHIGGLGWGPARWSGGGGGRRPQHVSGRAG